MVRKWTAAVGILLAAGLVGAVRTSADIKAPPGESMGSGGVIRVNKEENAAFQEYRLKSEDKVQFERIFVTETDVEAKVAEGETYNMLIIKNPAQDEKVYVTWSPDKSKYQDILEKMDEVKVKEVSEGGEPIKKGDQHEMRFKELDGGALEVSLHFKRGDKYVASLLFVYEPKKA